MHVAALLKHKGGEITTALPTTTIEEAAKLLASKKIGAVPVVDAGGALKGILSERDIVNAVAGSGARVLDAPVSSIMTANVITCGLNDTVEFLMATMTGRRFRHVPVIEGGKLVGIISIGDVVKNRLDEYMAEVDSLRQYVASGV